MLSEIGDRHERFNWCLHTRCNYWRNVRPFHMIETIFIVLAIGVFFTLGVLVGLFLFWIRND
jgi:hypothetical protein